MSVVDSVGVAIALVFALVQITCRRWLAAEAMRQYELMFGRRYEPRAFESGFVVGGIIFFGWAVFVVVIKLIPTD